MRSIEFLGTSGTRTPTEGTTCLRISKHCVIDAGNLIAGLKDELFDIEHIFLTHSHLDHIIDIPFVADLFVTHKNIPLKVYALKSTLKDLQNSIFNHRIWPNFAEIDLIASANKTIEFIEISPETVYTIDDITLKPFKTNHTDGSCGYVIQHENNAILFTSDTYKCNRIWELLEENSSIHSVIIDVSFPSDYEKLAQDSKHLTPKLLLEERLTCSRNDFLIYPFHLKAQFEPQIRQELRNSLIQGLVQETLSGFSFLPFNSQMNLHHHDNVPSAISQIITIGTALSAEKNIDNLLEMIIVQSKQLTNADGGTLYLYLPQTKQLEFKVIQNDSLNIKMGGTAGTIAWPPLDLFHPNGEPNLTLVAGVCALRTNTINIEDVYHSNEYDFSGTIEYDKKTGYRSESMLVLPLKDHEDQLIGVLQLINKKSPLGLTIPFDHSDESLALSLGSQAAVALTKQKLIDDLELLLESFLNTINVAIEEKSPYTAGHIERMMQLSLTLAQAINEDTTIFAEKKYTQDELKQIKFAALMHDIGKITTPEHIIDKSTKLETIHDRIHCIQLKYEILKRDAQINFLLSSKDEASERAYQQTLLELEEEFTFLANANEGSELFSDEKVSRILAISQRSIEIGGISQPLLNDDEVHNLVVQKGTLTAEQRQIINNHADVSLKMLNKLPFPHKLERVAEIACGHHEKINGKGYPLGLKGDQLSFEARILAIADIFEALSASDRPYKKAKKLSEVMKILFFMAKDDDIDRDLLRFFYESGLYLKYAHSVLPPENVDSIELDFKSLMRD